MYYVPLLIINNTLTFNGKTENITAGAKVLLWL